MKIYPYRWVILAVFMSMNFVLQIEWLAHAAVARPAEVFYYGQFNPASFFNIDFLAMVYMLVYILISLPASYITDTYGIKTGLGIGAVLAGVSGLAKGLFASNFTGVMIAQVGLAVSQPFILNAVTAVSVRWFPLRERGLAAGLSALAQYVGILVAMLVTPLMIGGNPDLPDYGNGFKSMLMVYGGITFVVSLLSLILIKEYPPTPPSTEPYERHSFIAGLKYIVRQKDALITIFLFLIGLGIFNAISSMTDSISEHLGIKDSNGLIGGMMLIGGIIGAAILPALSDKYRKRKSFLVVCIIGTAPGIFGLAFAGQLFANPQVIYGISLASAFILGFFIMSAGPIGFQYTAEVSAPAPESTSQGLLLWTGQITGLIFVAGMSTRHNALLPSFMTGFAILSLVLIVGVLMLKESPMISKEKTPYK